MFCHLIVSLSHGDYYLFEGHFLLQFGSKEDEISFVLNTPEQIPF